MSEKILKENTGVLIIRKFRYEYCCTVLMFLIVVANSLGITGIKKVLRWEKIITLISNSSNVAFVAFNAMYHNQSLVPTRSKSHCFLCFHCPINQKLCCALQGSGRCKKIFRNIFHLEPCQKIQ